MPGVSTPRFYHLHLLHLPNPQIPMPISASGGPKGQQLHAVLVVSCDRPCWMLVDAKGQHVTEVNNMTLFHLSPAFQFLGASLGQTR